MIEWLIYDCVYVVKEGVTRPSEIIPGNLYHCFPYFRSKQCYVVSLVDCKTNAIVLHPSSWSSLYSCWSHDPPITWSTDCMLINNMFIPNYCKDINMVIMNWICWTTGMESIFSSSKALGYTVVYNHWCSHDQWWYIHNHWCSHEPWW